MNGVVLRCRTCGTTQEHPGECDVCSAGPVAYFCGNHSPGVWLDAPVCDTCGARFGDLPAKAAAPSSSGAPSVPRSGTRRSASVRPGPGPTRTATPGLRRMPRPAAPPPPGTVTDGGAETDPPSLADLLVDMMEAGRRGRGAAIEPPPAAPRAPRIGLPIVGCLFRLVLILVVLGLLALAAVSMLVNATF